jgi:hypothetical protein
MFSTISLFVSAQASPAPQAWRAPAQVQRSCQGPRPGSGPWPAGGLLPNAPSKAITPITSTTTPSTIRNARRTFALLPRTGPACPQSCRGDTPSATTQLPAVQPHPSGNCFHNCDYHDFVPVLPTEATHRASRALPLAALRYFAGVSCEAGESLRAVDLPAHAGRARTLRLRLSVVGLRCPPGRCTIAKMWRTQKPTGTFR